MESLYKECQWHTNEDETMCESKASIWWNTVHWSQCNSYEGMHRHIQMPSRYWANFKEEVCLLPYPLRLMISTVHNLLTVNLLATLLLIGFFTKPYWGAHRSFDATCETREGNKKKKKLIVLSCYSNVNASGVLCLPFSKQEKKHGLLV